MRITKHKDGRFTMSEMTLEDVRELAMGASWAAAVYAAKSMRRPAMQLVYHDWDTPELNEREMNLYDRLRNALDVAGRSSLAGPDTEYLPYGKTMQVTSKRYADDDPDAPHYFITGGTQRTPSEP